MKVPLTHYQLFAALITCIILSACKKEVAENETTVNRPPVANAGVDFRIPLSTSSITLDGSLSADPDNNIKSYLWKKIEGPSAVALAESNGVKATVVNLAVGICQFELTVTDAGGLFSKDTVQFTVTVLEGTCDIDNRPVIHARLVPLGKVSFPKTNMLIAAANNKILFTGGGYYVEDGTGISARTIDIYDINNNSWSSKVLAENPTFRVDMAIAATDDKVLIAGGGFWGDDIYTSEVNIYHPADDSWSSDWLSVARTAATGVTAGNKVFFAGGYSYDEGGNYVTKTVDIYDNATNTWTTGELSQPRMYLSAVAAGNKVYFFAGRLDISDRIDEYDLLTNSWSTSKFRETFSGIAAISAGNKLFFAGGKTDYGESGVVEIRDVATGGISYDCIIPRSGLTAVLKDDKIVFFTGTGSDSRNGTHFEIYNVITGTWYTAVLDKNITEAAVISVNNVIYVAGGFVNGDVSDQVWKLEF